jgi:hypothetical protein
MHRRLEALVGSTGEVQVFFGLEQFPALKLMKRNLTDMTLWARAKISGHNHDITSTTWSPKKYEEKH